MSYPFYEQFCWVCYLTILLHYSLQGTVQSPDEARGLEEEDQDSDPGGKDRSTAVGVGGSREDQALRRNAAAGGRGSAESPRPREHEGPDRLHVRTGLHLQAGGWLTGSVTERGSALVNGVVQLQGSPTKRQPELHERAASAWRSQPG